MFRFWNEKPRRGNMLGLCQEHNLRVMNSYYQKKHTSHTRVEVMKVREVRIKNCKVIPEEACLTQHRFLCD